MKKSKHSLSLSSISMYLLHVVRNMLWTKLIQHVETGQEVDEKGHYKIFYNVKSGMVFDCWLFS